MSNVQLGVKGGYEDRYEGQEEDETGKGRSLGLLEALRAGPPPQRIHMKGGWKDGGRVEERWVGGGYDEIDLDVSTYFAGLLSLPCSHIFGSNVLMYDIYLMAAG